MTHLGYTFDSPLGRCGVVWSDGAIHALQLPEASEARLWRALRRTASPLERVDAPPDGIGELVRRVQGHLAGRSDRRGFADVAVDMARFPRFTRTVYQTARRIPAGKVVGYGDLAAACGSPGASRAVGQAMAHNPLPLIVPCHRVLAADGQLGGFSSHGGIATKLRLLTLEGTDLEPIGRGGVRMLRRDDPRLAALIHAVGPFPLLRRRRGDPFNALVESIIHQQVSMKAGAAIYRRMTEVVGRPPTPAAIRARTPDQLRAAGVSAQKSGYLHDLSHRVLEGSLPLGALQRQDDEAVIEALTRVKGIGRWSAQMFLIFHLGRLDVLPVDDLGLRKGAQAVLGLRQLPDARRLQQLARRWTPFRSIATWYLWRALDAGGLS